MLCKVTRERTHARRPLFRCRMFSPPSSTGQRLSAASPHNLPCRRSTVHGCSGGAPSAGSQPTSPTHCCSAATEQAHKNTRKLSLETASAPAAPSAENYAHPEKTGPSNFRCMNTIRPPGEIATSTSPRPRSPLALQLLLPIGHKKNVFSDLMKRSVP